MQRARVTVGTEGLVGESTLRQSFRFRQTKTSGELHDLDELFKQQGSSGNQNGWSRLK
jgi:hypothetical protein